MEKKLTLEQTIRALGQNVPRPSVSDSTVASAKGDEPAGEIAGSAAEYTATRNKVAQIKTKIIDDEYHHNGETQMDMSEKPSASFIEAVKNVVGKTDYLNEKKKAKPDFLDFDGDGNTKEPMKKALKDKDMKKEEVENLDEISSDLAKRYAQSATNPYRPNSLPNVANKLSDTTKTRTKIPGNSTIGSIQAAVKDHEDTLNNAPRKLKNRVTGIARATARMEEVENLDEISNTTLKSYISKARSNKSDHGEILQRQTHQMMMGVKRTSSEKERGAKAALTYGKRSAGISAALRAMKRNEEVEVTESATVLLKKAGTVKRLFHPTPEKIAKYQREGWIVVNESAFIEAIASLYEINESIETVDELFEALIEGGVLSEARGRPKKSGLSLPSGHSHNSDEGKAWLKSPEGKDWASKPENAKALTNAKRRDDDTRRAAEKAAREASGVAPRGRGRPKKTDTSKVTLAKEPSKPATLGAKADEKPATPAASNEIPHIIAQLNNARLGITKTIKHANGEETNITPDQAATLHSKMVDQNIRPLERMELQKSTNASASNFKAALSGKKSSDGASQAKGVSLPKAPWMK